VGFIQELLQFDAAMIAGQAKNHCVAWTIDDRLEDILIRGKELAEKAYLLKDCISPVVVHGFVDFPEAADASFRRFAETGIHIVLSTNSIQI
jgi:nicotinamidase-related amidase